MTCKNDPGNCTAPNRKTRNVKKVENFKLRFLRFKDDLQSHDADRSNPGKNNEKIDRSCPCKVFTFEFVHEISGENADKELRNSILRPKSFVILKDARNLNSISLGDLELI